MTLVKARQLGIIGYPVTHSLSPLIHNTALRAQGRRISYVKLNVAPNRLASTVKRLLDNGFLGANVTIPHKENVIPFLDTLSACAQAVGAVNTIVVQGDRLHGDNTDVAGFLAPLDPYADAVRGSDMVILGAGGAARAVAYALLSTLAPRTVTVAARRLAPAERIVADFSRLGPLSASLLRDAGDTVRQARLVVNTTPVGMVPHVDATPWPEPALFHGEQLVYDLVYRPRETRLMQEAASQGAAVLGGLPMLIGQAAAAYEQWTKQAMPREAVTKALEGLA